MTQLENAKRGTITSQMEQVAKEESIDVESLRQLIAAGRIVIPANKNHKNLHPVGIGKQLKTKVNANIGTSCDYDSIEEELIKLKVVIDNHADTVMDLSTGGDITKIRRKLVENSPIPFGNVPIYQMAVETVDKGKDFSQLKLEEIFDYLQQQAEDGVDFMTLHTGLTRRGIERLKMNPRKAGIVSRGGSLITYWMDKNNKENPLYEHFDRILKTARTYDVTLSLGDGLRPGSLADGTDWAQVEELLTLGELVKTARNAGVQVMVEGPGHLEINQIKMNIQMQKALCDEAPFYVLGPLVTDIAPGYDHITAAMGGAIAGAAGADFICYVTPTEHLGLPQASDVKEGIIAARIAAHVSDIAKQIQGASEWDRQMAEARGRLDWKAQEKLSIDPEKFSQIRTLRKSETDACSMCGKLCVYKILKDFK